jgi:hypothetical protein
MLHAAAVARGLLSPESLILCCCSQSEGFGAAVMRQWRADIADTEEQFGKLEDTKTSFGYIPGESLKQDAPRRAASVGSGVVPDINIMKKRKHLFRDLRQVSTTRLAPVRVHNTGDADVALDTCTEIGLCAASPMRCSRIVVVAVYVSGYKGRSAEFDPSLPKEMRIADREKRSRRQDAAKRGHLNDVNPLFLGKDTKPIDPDELR